MPRKTYLSNEQIANLKKFIAVQDGSAKELARAQGVLMYEKKLDFELINEMVGLKKSVILKWRARLIHRGVIAFLNQKKKEKTSLTKTDIEQIVNMLKDKNPTDYGYKTAFWTTSILAELIKDRYNVICKAKKRLYLLFKRAKFTYHKPGKQYRNHNQDQTDQWVANNELSIREHCADENTVVLTGDEMVLSTQTTFQKIWLPANNYPKVDVSNKRQNRSIYGFLNVKTGAQHAFKRKHQNSTITCSVLNELCLLYEGKNIVLIWDNASWHRSAEVRLWLSTTKHKIKLIAFPVYSPELNPQEHVWKAGRSHVSHNKFIESIDDAADEFVNYLNATRFNYKLLNLVHA